jgi:iron complex transport system substrate-binding protein
MAPDPTPLRIVSLLPATTEIACALGLGGQLVGRSHECDVPPEVAALPVLTSPRLDPSAPSREIHEAVGRAASADGGTAALFTLDADRLAAVAPDLILTQAACDVCAVSADEVRRVAASLPKPARVVAVNPARLRDVLDDIISIGRETGTLPKARELVARLQARIDSVACRVRTLREAPRVAVVEWLDPPMAAGNWVPEMVALAGGIDVLGRKGEHSHWISWDDLTAADPDVVVLVPCGFTLERVVEEASSPACRTRLAALRASREGRVVAVDGHHLFNRPGPRLVDSLEVLTEILHPAGFRFPATRRFTRVIQP